MMNDLISRGKLLKDLAGMYDVLTGAGDPFLASMTRKAMECVEKQPTTEADEEPVTDDLFWKAVLLFEAEFKAAQKKSHVYNPLAYALHQVWKKADTGKL